MSTGVVFKSLESNLETNNLNTYTSASQEAYAKAAMLIKVILAAEFGVPGARVASSGGIKDSVSFGGWNEMLPNTQIINRLWQVRQLSQDHQATDIQWSYLKCDGLDLTRSEVNWQFNHILSVRIKLKRRGHIKEGLVT